MEIEQDKRAQLLKKKILFILHLPPPVHGAAMVGKYIMDSHAINEKYVCDYINLSTSRDLAAIGSWNIKKLLYCLRLYFQVFASLIKNRYNLCYLTINSKGTGYYKEIVIVLILKLFRQNIIYHYHNKGIAENHHHLLQNFFYKIQFKNSRAILLSRLLYQDIKKYLPPSRVYYCANGVPLTRNNISKELRLNRQEQVATLLFLSNLKVDKGVFTLLEASKLLFERSVKFQLVLIGGLVDITEEELKSFIEKNNLQRNVIYRGEKFGKAKLKYLEEADIFIQPTMNDCFPLSILEAMQYGLPVIASREGAIPEIIQNEETGLLVKKGDAHDLCEKIQYLIENVYERRKMGRSAKERFIEFYGLEKFERNFIKVLNKVVDNNEIKL